MSITSVSTNAEAIRRELTFDFIQSASKSLGDIFRPSFGPKGTYKMYTFVATNNIGLFLVQEKSV